MGYSRVTVSIEDRGETVRVKVPGGPEAVIPKSSLCKFLKRFNFEADGIKC